MPTPVATPFEEEAAGRKSRARSKPEFLGGRPKIPKHLSDDARAEWRRCVKLMEQRRTITPGDAAMLSVYAVIDSRWITALAAMGDRLEVEYTVLSATGLPVLKTKINPLLAVAQKCETEIKSIAEKLGLAPVSRARVEPTSKNVNEPPQEGTAAWMVLQGGKE